MYRGLAKQCPWAEHLTSPLRGEWALFRVLPHLTTKERQCHVYSDSIPSKQIIGPITMYNRNHQWLWSVVQSWRHTMLWTAPYHGEHGIAHGALHLVSSPMQKCLVLTFGELLQEGSYITYAEQLRLCFSKSMWSSSQDGRLFEQTLTLYRKLGQKQGLGTLPETTVCICP